MDPCLETGDREWLLVMVAGLTRSTPDGVGGLLTSDWGLEARCQGLSGSGLEADGQGPSWRLRINGWLPGGLGVCGHLFGWLVDWLVEW